MQTAIGIIAARAQGDRAAAAHLLTTFTDDEERIASFAVATELALRLWAQTEQRSVHSVARELALYVAQATP